MSSGIVVSNASPLIALEQIGRLDLLDRFFPRLLVPPAVAEEVAPSVSLPSSIEKRTLTQLMAEDFRVATALYESVLRDAGEL